MLHTGLVVLLEDVVDLPCTNLLLYIEQNRTEYLFCLSIYSLSQLQSYKMHGLLNIHMQANNYSLDVINFTLVLE